MPEGVGEPARESIVDYFIMAKTINDDGCGWLIYYGYRHPPHLIANLVSSEAVIN